MVALDLDTTLIIRSAKKNKLRWHTASSKNSCQKYLWFYL